MKDNYRINSSKNIMLSAKRFLASRRLPLAGVPLLHLIPWLNVLIAALLAFSLAQLTWLLVTESNGEAAVPLPAIAPSSAPAAKPPASLARVAALHLLGRSDEPPPAQQQAPISAPETRLNLTLRGLVALDSQDAALAIIAQGGGDEQSYKVGDTVPGGALLYEIHADRVILERGGRFETLTLPREKMESATAPAQSALARPLIGGDVRAGQPVDARQLRALRENLLKNPQEAMQLINAQPVMDGGQMKGYRVNPGRDRKLFNNVGLRPGDIVTSVNGIPLNDLSQMGALFNQLSSANRLDVTLERGGRETQLSLGLD
jgi:general secretion pathway protein C